MSAGSTRRSPVGKPWQPGQSGNPAGRPKVAAEIRELARTYTEDAIKTLVELMHEGEEPVRVSCAQALLDRGYGKPVQSITLDDEHELSKLTDEELRRRVTEKAALLALAPMTEEE